MIVVVFDACKTKTMTKIPLWTSLLFLVVLVGSTTSSSFPALSSWTSSRGSGASVFVQSFVISRNTNNNNNNIFINNRYPFYSIRHPKHIGRLFQTLRGGGLEIDVDNNDAVNNNADSKILPDPGSLPLSLLLQTLQSDPNVGLTETDAHRRLQLYGPNELAAPPKQSIWELIAEQFQDRLVQILLVVAVISAVFSALEHTADQNLLKSFVEPIVILSILVLNAAVGVIQSQSAKDSLQALQELQPTLCTPLRDGTLQANVPASELVPGDIIQLRVGDKIPADARVVELQSSTLQVDETSLTGESVTVGKLAGEDGVSEPGAPLQAQPGMVFAGTMVTAGNALAVVTSTGMSTQFGKIQQGVTDAQQDLQKTPLAIKLDEFGNQLTVIIGIICVAVWLVSIPKMGGASFTSKWDGAVYYAKVAVALGVAAIPEGLPAVITLCLSLGTRRMAQRNVLVRRLPSVETLGCTSVICTDKTGTLTTNEMTAVSLVVMEKKGGIVEHSIEGVSYSPVGKIDGIIKNDEIQQYPKGAIADVAAVAALCNDASIVGKDDISENNGASGRNSNLVTVERAYERTGEPTEAALCVLAEKLGGLAIVDDDNATTIPPSSLASANVDAWRTNFPRKATLEFNRERKSEEPEYSLFAAKPVRLLMLFSLVVSPLNRHVCSSRLQNRLKPILNQ
jgi:magnesium-transporting ATPase (P-type)